MLYGITIPSWLDNMMERALDGALEEETVGQLEQAADAARSTLEMMLNAPRPMDAAFVATFDDGLRRVDLSELVFKIKLAHGAFINELKLR